MKTQKIIAIIPARYGSTRFPGKALAPILGKTLICRTYENTLRCPILDEVYVATDDQRIYDHVVSFGGKAIMTGCCSNGTERIFDALQQEPSLKDAKIILNVQGDHPCISANTMEKVLQQLLSDQEAPMATAASPIDPKDATSSNVVKCTFDRFGNALYFSRSPIPFNGTSPYYHVGLYAYRTPFLNELASLRDTPLQQAEDLEQLKVLENGYRIKIALVNEEILGVDVPEDIQKIEKYLCP